MKAVVNKSHIEGYIYEHTLESKVSGPNSKNPGTEFISGNLSVATDEAILNIVTVHFSYVTPTTKNGGTNSTYTALSNIISGAAGNIMQHGKEKAAKVRIDSAIGLNEFYTERNGKTELVSAKRNEGGFVHLVDTLNEDEKARSTFECDMLITKATRIEPNEEKNIPEKVVIKGCIFDFRKALLPYDFKVTNKKAMDYFEDLEVSPKSPVFTHLKGRQLSSVVKKTFVEEGAFGEDSVREVVNSRKDYILHWAAKETYPFDDEETITKEELKKAREDRNTYLADVKKRNDDYKANKGNAIGSTKTVAPVAAKAADDDNWDF